MSVMKTIHDKALDYARARKAFLDLKSAMRKLKCTESEPSDYSVGYSGQPPCSSGLLNCDEEDWCDNCKARKKMFSQWGGLSKEQRKAWNRVRYEMIPRKHSA